MTQQKASSELAHYGVKGMKWGVRRAEKNKPNEGYSRDDRTLDTLRFRSGGVKRINRRMNKGASLKEARRKETQRTAVKAAALVVAYNTPRIARAVAGALDTHGPRLASSIHDRAETKRGRARAADTMGLGNAPKFTKKNRKGVYNISSM